MPIYQGNGGIEQLAARPPKRILSVVPSITELLSDLGLDQQVPGITKFCVHPEDWFRRKPRVGGTKSLNLEKIRSLQPELIIANKEENQKQQIESLAGEFDIWLTEIHNLKEAIDMIVATGRITGTLPRADWIRREIEYRFQQIPRIDPPLPGLYLIWKDPWMTVGGDCFIHDLLQYCGIQNTMEAFARYPQLDWNGLSNNEANCILLASEPYPFRNQHAKLLGSQLKGKQVICVDGEMFAWYGSRLLQAPAYFQELIRRLRPAG